MAGVGKGVIATAGATSGGEVLPDPTFEAVAVPDARRLYSLALSILRDQGEAEDAVQETLLIVFGATVPLSFVPAIHGKPLSVEITAGPSVAWEVAVADSGPVVPLLALAAATRPAGAHVIVAMTYGVGTSSVETLFPTGPYYVQYACTGTGTVDISTSGGSTDWVSKNCANGAIRTQMAAKPTSSGPINLTVEVAPRIWETVIYELPRPKS